MLQLRAPDTLGGGNRDWLKARHHFAVDSQGNPAHGRLGNLLVWNDDEIAPHSGFPLLPRRLGLDPRWATKPFADTQRSGRLMPIASGFPEDQDALRIEADARVLGATVEAGQRIAYPLTSTRYGYLVPARGRVMVNDQQVGERDGIAIAGEPGIAITAIEPAEIILVDTA
jgi:redox-sensitive bicupin YhaK (pirin superfamily)